MGSVVDGTKVGSAVGWLLPGEPVGEVLWVTVGMVGAVADGAKVGVRDPQASFAITSGENE